MRHSAPCSAATYLPITTRSRNNAPTTTTAMLPAENLSLRDSTPALEFIAAIVFTTGTMGKNVAMLTSRQESGSRQQTCSRRYAAASAEGCHAATVPVPIAAAWTLPNRLKHQNGAKKARQNGLSTSSALRRIP